MAGRPNRVGDNIIDALVGICKSQTWFWAALLPVPVFYWKYEERQAPCMVQIR